MSIHSLENVAEAVLRLAKRQGHVTARQIRSEMCLAGLDETGWKDALACVRSALVLRQGRYYHKEAYNPRLQKEHAQLLAIQKVVRRLIRRHKERVKSDERRGQTRIDFIQPVKVRTEDGAEYTLLSRDLSATGVRLLGTKRLLGNKVQLTLPTGADQPPCRLLVRILWTCAVGDDLFENGGIFLQLLPAESDT